MTKESDAGRDGVIEACARIAQHVVDASIEHEKKWENSVDSWVFVTSTAQRQVGEQIRDAIRALASAPSEAPKPPGQEPGGDPGVGRGEELRDAIIDAVGDQAWEIINQATRDGKSERRELGRFISSLVRDRK